MVTVEIAVGIMSVGAVVAAVVWLIALLVSQVQLVNTATEVARQVARDDTAAVERARSDAPAGTRVTEQVTDGQVRVEARLDARPFGPRFLTVPLVAHATVEAE